MGPHLREISVKFRRGLEGAPAPNLVEYDTERTRFQWTTARDSLDGLPGGAGLNIAHEAVDRHAADPVRAGQVALRLLGKGGQRQEVTYAALAERTSRFANALTNLGVGAGDVVAVLCGRQLDLYVSVLGSLKCRCVVSPMFSAFGPEPIRARLELGRRRCW